MRLIEERKDVLGTFREPHSVFLGDKHAHRQNANGFIHRTREDIIDGLLGV